MDYSRLCRIQHESREPVEHVIDQILTRGAEILYMKYVLAKQPDFLGELYAKSCGTLLDLVNLSHDKGDDKKMVRKFWTEDKEPTPATIDSWARHRVAVDRPEPEPKKEEDVSASQLLRGRLSVLRPNPKDDYSYCSFTEPENVEKFLNEPFEADFEKLPVPPR